MRGKPDYNHYFPAKITPPELSEIYIRKRLFHLIDQQRDKRPIMWVSGPAGSGKTTLATSLKEILNVFGIGWMNGMEIRLLSSTIWDLQQRIYDPVSPMTCRY